MDFNRFTEKLQEAVRAGQGKAVRYGNQQIDVEHLLAALLEQEGGLASSVLTRAGVNVDALSKKLTGELERLPKVSGGASGIDQIYVTPRQLSLFDLPLWQSTEKRSNFLLRQCAHRICSNHGIN